jgi:hypothetical protein
VSGTFLPRVVRGYRQIGARLGLFVLLVVLSAGLGALIAFPLWLFATAVPRAYTIAVLAAAAAAVAAAVTRRILRTGLGWSRAAARVGLVLLGIAKALLLLVGLYAAAAFAARRLFVPAAVGALVFLAAAAWIGWGVREGTARKPPATGRY